MSRANMSSRNSQRSQTYVNSPTPRGPGNPIDDGFGSDLRRRQNKRDESIRQKMEKDLAKKRPTAARQRSTRKAAPGTVSSLRPTPPMTVSTDMTVHEAAQLMAAKREDCVLVISPESHLAGIFTAKDLAFRVIAAGKNPSNTPVAEIMTPNPMCTRIDTSATEALDLMVTKGFRHLPVVDEEGDVSGVLDITKCFYEAMEKLERAYESSKKLYEALEGVQTEMGAAQQPAPIIEYVETLKRKMAGPDLASVLDGTPPAWVTVKTSVREATELMKSNHTTAVLVMDGENLAGIFTSKDVVLRVVAPGLDAGNCSVVRVMTPHPDCAPSTLSIQQALRKMNDGHYLNLPVTDEEDTIVGMVDVLKLTYATLEQVNSMNTSTDEGPMWSKFWGSTGGDDDGSVVSASDTPSRQSAPNTIGVASIASGTTPASNGTNDAAGGAGVINPFADQISPLPLSRVDDYESPVRPGDSVSAMDSREVLDSFSFKFKAPSGRIHRFASTPANGLDSLRSVVRERLSDEDAAEVSEAFLVSYVDDDGDIVTLSSDEDLIEAVAVARKSSRDKVDLYVHHPDKAAVPVTAQPAALHEPPVPEQVVAAPPAPKETQTPAPDERAAPLKATSASSGKAKSGAASHGAEAAAGNNLLIPGAICVLAVAIVGVFVISRSSKN